MSLHDDLREQAGHLATREPRRPRQASLRRAVSAAYYALFHRLIDDATRQSLGGSATRRRYRQALARAFGHSAMVKCCKSFAGGTFPRPVVDATGPVPVPLDLVLVAQTMVLLQQERHRADYNLSATFTRSEVQGLLLSLDQASAAWDRVREQDVARFFLAALPLWDSLRS
jgi:hypothetical protein